MNVQDRIRELESRELSPGARAEQEYKSFKAERTDEKTEFEKLIARRPGVQRTLAGIPTLSSRPIRRLRKWVDLYGKISPVDPNEIALKSVPDDAPMPEVDYDSLNGAETCVEGERVAEAIKSISERPVMPGSVPFLIKRDLPEFKPFITRADIRQIKDNPEEFVSTNFECALQRLANKMYVKQLEIKHRNRLNSSPITDGTVAERVAECDSRSKEPEVFVPYEFKDRAKDSFSDCLTDVVESAKDFGLTNSESLVNEIMSEVLDKAVQSEDYAIAVKDLFYKKVTDSASEDDELMLNTYLLTKALDRAGFDGVLEELIKVPEKVIVGLPDGSSQEMTLFGRMKDKKRVVKYLRTNDFNASQLIDRAGIVPYLFNKDDDSEYSNLMAAASSQAVSVMGRPGSNKDIEEIYSRAYSLAGKLREYVK